MVDEPFSEIRTHIVETKISPQVCCKGFGKGFFAAEILRRKL